MVNYLYSSFWTFQSQLLDPTQKTMDAVVYPFTVRDLTGHVVKTEQYNFAHGGNSDIWKGLWNKDSGSIVEVAVKVMKGVQDAFVNTRLLREIRVWASVNHPNISPFFGVSLNFDRPLTPCLVSPYYRHGDILKYLKDHSRVNELPLIVHISEALSYLHGKGIAHGNIKGSNILINDKHDAVLSDFGLARNSQTLDLATRASPRTGDVTTDLAWEDEGSLPATTEAWRWKAPEFIGTHVDGQEESICRVTTATDVYAFSITVIEIFTGCIPFSHIKNDARVVIAIVEGGRPKRTQCLQITDDIWRFLEMCWNVEPNQRPSMDTVLNFFKLQSTPLNTQIARL